MKNLTIILWIVSSTAFAQKMKLVRGNLQGLKDQKSYSIKFTYDSMLVGIDVPEKNYLQELRRRWEEKEPGKGHEFIQAWFDDRQKLYEPVFIRNFENFSGVTLGDADAKYTLVVKTTRTEGGWNLGIAGQVGEIDGELRIVESIDNSHVKAVIQFFDAKGINSDGGDFEMTTRIQSAYKNAGKWLGVFLKRKSR